MMKYKTIFGLLILLSMSVAYARGGITFSTRTDIGDGYDKCPFLRPINNCGVNPVINEGVLNNFGALIEKSFPAEVSCYSERSDKCHIKPEINSVCSCLGGYKYAEKRFGNNSASSSSEVNTKSEVDELGLDKWIKEGLSGMTIKSGVERFQAEINVNSNEKIQRGKYVAPQKAAMRGGGATIVTSSNIGAEADAEEGIRKIYDITKQNTNKNVKEDIKNDPIVAAGCLTLEQYDSNGDVPSEEAFKIINLGNKDAQSDQVRDIRDAVLRKVLKGDNIYSFSSDEIISQITKNNPVYSDSSKVRELNLVAKDILKSVATTDGDLHKGLKDLAVFAQKNSIWRKYLEKDPSGGLDEFIRIYHNGNNNDEDLARKILALRGRNEIKGIIKEVTDEKTRVLIKSRQLVDQGKWTAMYSEYDLLNQVIDIGNKGKKDKDIIATPSSCDTISYETKLDLSPENNLAKFDFTSQGNQSNPVYPKRRQTLIGNSVVRYPSLSSVGGSASHFSDETLFQGKIEQCKKLYSNICRNKSTDTSTDQEKKDVIDGINLWLADVKAAEIKRSEHEKYLASCMNPAPAKLKKGYGFGDKPVSIQKFIKSVCGKHGNRVKGLVADEELKRYCGDKQKFATQLKSLYMKCKDEKQSDATQVELDKSLDPDSQKMQAAIESFVAMAEAGRDFSSTHDQDGSCGILCTIGEAVDKRMGRSAVAGTNNNATSASGGKTFMDELVGGLNKAATTISAPHVENNVQAYLNGNLPASNIFPQASLANADASQLNSAKSSVDNGIAQLEKRLDSYEKKEGKSLASAQSEEVELLRKQIEELRQQSEMLKAQLDKEKESTKVAQQKSNIAEDGQSNAGRSIASLNDYKGISPQLGSPSSMSTNQNLQPSKIFDNMYGDNSFHGVPTIGSSKSIDSKAFTARSSNDALLSIYADKNVSSLVDAVASGSSSNILVVGNALEMQESTVKDKRFQTKEIMIDQTRLEQVRSNPESLKSLIEENKIKNHVGILTLKTGESQLNYIMRKDDSGKLVILPLNIARKVTLDSLKQELQQ